jgi:hypothetical protein
VVVAPAGALPAGARLEAREVTTDIPRRSQPQPVVWRGILIDPFPAPDALGATVLSPASRLVELAALDAAGQPLASLAGPLTLRLAYDSAALPPGAREADLALYRLSAPGAAAAWLPVEGAAVDPAAQRVIASVPGDGIYAAMVRVPAQVETLPGEQVYYAVTGHYVSFGILTAYRAAGGPTACGYPRSGEAPERGVTAQWFQRCRIEWHPELDGRVLFGLLGEEWLQAAAERGPLPPPTAGAALPGVAYASAEPWQCAETGIAVAGAFLAAAETLGLELTGFPITDELGEGGVRAQYFQRLRLEWRPDLGGMAVSNLGDALLALQGRL